MNEIAQISRASLATDERPESRTRASTLLAAGGVMAAIGASSCCVLPLVLFLAGASGAWISNLTALAPYQPVFLAVALVFLTIGFVRVYRTPKRACTADSCASPTSNRAAKFGLWAAAILILAAVTFPYAAPLFL